MDPTTTGVNSGKLQMPNLVLFHLLRMHFVFISVVVIAAFWTIQYSDYITVIFDNTINLMLEFQVSLQHSWHAGGSMRRE